MLFDISNPSDAYTFEAESFPVAAAAILLVGQGKLGTSYIGPEKNGPSMPPFILADESSISKWLLKNCGFSLESFAEFMEENWAKVADALDSVVVGNKRDRELYLLKLEKVEGETERAAFKAKWQDENSSSMNNIGKACWEDAKHIRETHTKGPSGG
jgi:predicted transposase YbfD/YdcC